MFGFIRTQMDSAVPESVQQLCFLGFGAFVVKSGQCEEWRVKVKSERGMQGTVVLGVRDTARSGAWFGLDVWNGTTFGRNRRSKYLRRARSGDVVTMTLDLTGQTGMLSYTINGEQPGLAFDSINVHQEYRMTLSMHAYDGSELRIVE